MEDNYKLKLQQLCHKRGYAPPSYTVEKDGADHNPRFTATVVVDELPFQSTNSFRRSNEAQIAAAKAALDCLTPRPPSPVPPPPPQDYEDKNQLSTTMEGIEKADGGVLKTLLQQLAVKYGHQLPVYTTSVSGPYMRTFASSVEVRGETYAGEVFSTKKKSEASAARVALETLALGIAFVNHTSKEAVIQEVGAKKIAQLKRKTEGGDCGVEGCSSAPIQGGDSSKAGGNEENLKRLKF